MSAHSRLTTVLEDGTLAPPSGPVAVMRPQATYDVSTLGRDETHIVHSFRPDVTAWESAGYPVTQSLPAVSMAIVVVPRAKGLARAMIAEAASRAQIVVVDGAKTDGIDSLYKACKARLGPLPSVTKDHGRLFWFSATDVFADWAAPEVARGAHGYYTTAGVFSDGSIDAGSELLVAHLPNDLPAHMADLGAGWGYLSQAVLQRGGVKHLDLVEAEALSLECARLNVTDPRAAYHWADATTHMPDKLYDGIVMNPPFHQGRAADPGLGRAFITAAARQLAPHGKLWMVANSHLPYEETLREAFHRVDTVIKTKTFKVISANKPQRARRT